MIPLVDLAAIPADLAREDYLAAGLDLFGAIPVVGEVADVAKLVKMADNGIDLAKTIDKSSDVRKTVKKSKNIINKQKKGTPRNNRVQNKQADSVSKKLKLSPKQRRELHDLIHGQNWGLSGNIRKC